MCVQTISWNIDEKIYLCAPEFWIKQMAMYAIVNIKGQQVKVEEGAELFVNRIDAEAGDKIAFDEVLLIDADGDVKLGTPHLKATVNATVIDQVKGDKTIVFKKKRRKGYKVKNGHRQQFTKIKVDSIKA